MKKLIAILMVAGLGACSGGSDDDGNIDVTPSLGEPNGTLAQATQLTLGTPVSGTVATRDDLDFYKFTIPAGGATIRVQTFDSGGVECDPDNGNVDTLVDVYDAFQAKVWDYETDGEDQFAPFCEDFEVMLPEGVNYVMVNAWLPVPTNYVLVVSIPTT